MIVLRHFQNGLIAAEGNTILVRLSTAKQEQVEEIAKATMERAESRGLRSQNRWGERNADEEILGLAGEVAVAAYLQVPHRNSPGVDEVDLLDWIEVKTGSKSHFGLPVKLYQLADHKAYVLVHGDLEKREYRIKGWIWGHELRKIGTAPPWENGQQYPGKPNIYVRPNKVTNRITDLACLVWNRPDPSSGAAPS